MDRLLVVRGLNFLPLPVAAGVPVSGAEVSVSAWASRAAPAGKADHLALSFVTGGENAGSYG